MVKWCKIAKEKTLCRDFMGRKEGRKEGNVLFNDALNTFLFYGYMASDIW